MARFYRPPDALEPPLEPFALPLEALELPLEALELPLEALEPPLEALELPLEALELSPPVELAPVAALEELPLALLDMPALAMSRPLATSSADPVIAAEIELPTETIAIAALPPRSASNIAYSADEEPRLSRTKARIPRLKKWQCANAAVFDPRLSRVLSFFSFIAKAP